MNNITKEEFYHVNPDHKIADIMIGILYLICFVCGVPSNILSFYYFSRRRFKSMDIPTFLYTLTALNDSVTSFLVLNNGVTMLRNREVWLAAFCATQHILFQMTQRMSVFLIAMLSTTRTYSLIFPLRRIKIVGVQIVTGLFWASMTCFFVLPPLAGLVQITYHFEGGYCWAEPVPGNNFSLTWDTIDNAMDTIGLAFPVIPITASCVISTYKIMDSRKTKSHLTARKLSTSTMKRCSLTSKKSYRKATCTIILVTIFYILSNIPLFVNYVLYLITILSFSWPGPIYNSVVMYFYSWNITAILSTGLNASINPMIYLTRFKKYRKWMLHGCKADQLVSSSEYAHKKTATSASLFNKSKSEYTVRRLKELRFSKTIESRLLSRKAPELFSGMEVESRALSSGELITEN